MKILSFSYRYDLYIFSKYTKKVRKRHQLYSKFSTYNRYVLNTWLTKMDKLGDKALIYNE